MAAAWMRGSLVLCAALTLGGCAGLGVGDVLAAGSGNGDVSGEVRRVDERSRVIQVGSWFGSSHVRYDGRTRVIDDGRERSVRSLRSGDRVTVRVYRGNRGDLYADRIYLERRARDDRRRDDRRHEDRRHERLQYVEGRVHRIDHRQGWAEVRPSRGRNVVVTMPRRAARGVSDNFRRIRRGDHVRIEGIPTSRDRIEVVRII
jgi:hypothetical protein